MIKLNSKKMNIRLSSIEDLFNLTQKLYWTSLPKLGLKFLDKLVLGN